MKQVRDVQIRSETIRLGQLLKVTGIAHSGGEAKTLIGEGHVRVNGTVETRRGRQLRVGDELEVAGDRVRLAAG